MTRKQAYRRMRQTSTPERVVSWPTHAAKCPRREIGTRDAYDRLLPCAECGLTGPKSYGVTLATR